MYLFFLTLFIIISILIIILIILYPNKNNIIESSIHTRNINNKNINLNFFKKTLNNTIIILSILFFTITIILNNINNKKIKINNLLNKNNISKIKSKK